MTRRLTTFALSALLFFASAARAQNTQPAPASQTSGTNQTSSANQTSGATPAAPYKNYTPPRYKNTIVRSLYLTMRDGVRLAADVALPEGLPEGARVPAIVQLTRYWRAREGQRGASDLQRFFNAYGYAVVIVDTRGTGASFGAWPVPWSREEVGDGRDVVEWIVRQTWSDGKVGAVGSSYSGTTALLLAAPNHPAVKAVIPRHYEFDVYLENAWPGGVFNEWMVKTWDEGNHMLDLSPGVKPVDDDKDKTLLREAVKAHAANIELYKAALAVKFRDDRPFKNSSVEDFSVYNFSKDIGRSGVAVNNWGSWLDAGTADAVIKSFMTLRNHQRTIIGAWNHGASQNASPYHSPASPVVLQRMEWLRFFDYHLRGIDTGLASGKTLVYYTMGEERWKETRAWPPAGSTTTRMFLAEGNALAARAPRVLKGADSYTVDFEATTGEKNRWRTQLGGAVEYPDRAEADRRLLTYTSAPLDEDTEITGHPVVNLYVSSTVSDAALFVYLEDVDERGRVTYITEGQLRAVHRKVSNEKPPYWTNTPYHSFRSKDAAPLRRGATAEISFALLPTSVLIRKGHRLRLAIAGHDKSVFARTPAEGTPVYTFERNKRRASFVELPVVRRAPQSDAPVNLLTTVNNKATSRD